MRTSLRLLLGSVLAVLCLVVAGATPASAAPAQMRRPMWEVSWPLGYIAPTCMTKNVQLASGTYLWESYVRLAKQTSWGVDYAHISRHQERPYLRGGEYRWSTCIGYDAANGWIHSNSLTELATGGVARKHTEVNTNAYDYLWEYGANLWQCDTESVC
jgi:hypothetical protein